MTDDVTGLPPLDGALTAVVGLGASAGGLVPLERLFERLPDKTGLAYVVVQHLSPDFKSLMSEILGRHASMPIVTITEGTRLAPDTIFLIPPRMNITVVESQFVLTEMETGQLQRPVDVLFTSIAKGFGRRSVGIILSGTGSDGAEGIRAIHNAGGLTIVQSPDTAQFDGMPRNALSTDTISLTLPPEKIGAAIVSYATNLSRPDEEKELSSERLTGIRLVFSLLSDRHGINFSHYKESTVERRLERRMHARNCGDLTRYAELLRDDPGEVDALYHDLLIGVTKFFRDAEAFFALQSNITRVIGQLGQDEELRIWVAGCATGEEVYSVAMLVVEAFERLQRTPRAKILATDVHQGTLETAARGEYSPESLEFVSRERQGRFFTPAENHLYRVNAEIRRHIVFARHNLIEDAPFSKIHIVTCRNLLIYLQPEAQYRAIASFHFALTSNGLMMLGSSETPGKLDGEFETLDATWRIYRKLRSLPSLVAHSLDRPQAGLAPRRLANLLNRDRPEQMSFTHLLEAYDLLLGQFVESGVLLDENRNVLHVFGNANRYLKRSTGRFSGNIMRMLEGEARTTLGAALVRSAKEPNTRFVLRNVPIVVDTETLDVEMVVRSLTAAFAQRTTWFVEFKLPRKRSEAEETEVRVTRAGDDYEAMQAELTFAKESLNATIEELEASNEELQSTNEELTASNEELQSTNQELHSVNEELYSVNAEYHRKITELQDVTEDIENLLSSTDIGTVFVDECQAIRRFTPAAVKYFHLVAHDIGRPLFNFTNTLSSPELPDLIDSALTDGETRIKRASTTDGCPVLVKIVPYVSGGERKGVIINVFDIQTLLG